MNSKFPIFVILILLAGLLSCLSSTYTTHTGPPPRTIPLDSVKSDAGPYRLKPPPVILTVTFNVTGDQDCHTIVELYNVGRKLVRSLVDTVYSPGEHSITWNKRDNNNKHIKYGAYYYQFTICDRVSTKSLKYHPETY